MHNKYTLPFLLSAAVIVSTACQGNVELETRSHGHSLNPPTLVSLGSVSEKATSGVPEAIVVTWSRVVDPAVAGYYLYRDTQSIPDPGPEGSIDPGLRVNGGALIGDPGIGSEVVFPDDFGAAKPQIGIRYYYRVTVLDTDGEESYPSNEMSWLVHGHNVGDVTPASAYWGDSVSISGDTFGAYTAGSDEVKLQALGGGLIDAFIDNWSDTQIDITIPVNAVTGKVQVIIEGSMAESNNVLTILNPYITNLDPDLGFVEQSLKVEGANFGAAQLLSLVEIAGQDVSSAVNTWSDNEITLIVPDGVAKGDVIVTVSGVSGNGVEFTPRAEITALDLDSAQPGESLTLTGRYFGASEGTLKLVSGQVQNISTWSSNSITFTLSGNAGAQLLLVTTTDAVDSNEYPITVSEPLTVTISGLNATTYYTPAAPPSVGVTTAPDADSVELVIDGVVVEQSVVAPFSDLVLPVATLSNGLHTVSLVARRRTVSANSINQPVLVYSLVGDVNADGVVDAADVDALLPKIGLDSDSLGYRPWFDTDADGLVTEADLSAVGYFFGNANSAS